MSLVTRGFGNYGALLDIAAGDVLHVVTEDCMVHDIVSQLLSHSAGIAIAHIVSDCVYAHHVGDSLFHQLTD